MDDAPHKLLRLMADPHRWQLLQALAESDLRVGELVERVGRPQNLVSYHLRELRDAGLVSARQSSADRRDTYYRLEADRCARALADVSSVLRPTSSGTSARHRVLFLCTGNSARSQIAEAILRERSGGSVDARSAGSQPKALHPLAVQVMADRGIDISTATPKHLRRFARSRFDLVVTLCDRVREICPEFPGHPRTAHWSIADPSVDADEPAFVRTADELEARIDILLAQLNQPEEEHRDRSDRQRALSRR